MRKYRVELRNELKAAKEFSTRTKDPSRSTIKCVGQIGQVEASMLYILLRETQPKAVLEIGALCGSSTRWMLSALRRNKKGTLFTYDLHPFALDFIGEQSNWKFFVKDVLQEAVHDSNFVNRFDVLFIDALHTNKFADSYTRVLLANSKKSHSVFVHDIFSPFQIPEFKACQIDLRRQNVHKEIACIHDVAAKYADDRGGRDILYSPQQMAGEGLALSSWLARTGRSQRMISFSPYANLDFAFRILAIFEVHHLGDFLTGQRQVNNPSIFFQMTKYA